MSKGFIIVTGASSGIGREIAKTLSKSGHHLLLLARRVEKIEELALENSMCKKVDVTDSSSFQSAIDEARKKFGQVQGLINNAGVMLLGEIGNQNPTEWQKMFDVNVKGLLNGINCVVNEMKKNSSGTIINISSIAGKKTFPNHVAYCGTKFAVNGISENLREELSGKNVRVITISPGAVETELLGHTTSKDIVDGYEDWKGAMGGALSPVDVANAVLYAYEQPQGVCIREIVIAATKQTL